MENNATCISSHVPTLNYEYNFQMLPRRALQGINAEKAYRLPPLPPTVSTLQAFKSLLLQRRDLLSLASKQQKIGSNPDGNAPVKRKKGPVGRDAVVRGRHGRQSKVFPGMETKQPDHTDDATDATAAEQMPVRYLTSFMFIPHHSICVDFMWCRAYHFNVSGFWYVYF